MTWLVTGGAGYIGAHVVRAFAEQDIPTVVVDDLSSGHRAFVPHEVPFYEGNVTDGALLHQIFEQHRVAGVVHLAGFKYAGVSVSRPLHTYTQNVTGMVTLLEAMAAYDVSRFVFSSSAAVYGTPETGMVTEDTPTRPESPYGESKLVGEWLLADQARATADAEQPLRYTSLRYFNVVGSGYPELRDTSPHNLFPLVFDALAEGRVPHINGDRLPHPGRHLRPRLRARGGPGHLPRRRRPGVAGRRRAGAGLQPRQRDRALGPADHGCGRPDDRHRLRSRGPRPPTR